MARHVDRGDLGSAVVGGNRRPGGRRGGRAGLGGRKMPIPMIKPLADSDTVRAAHAPSSAPASTPTESGVCRPDVSRSAQMCDSTALDGPVQASR